MSSVPTPALAALGAAALAGAFWLAVGLWTSTPRDLIAMEQANWSALVARSAPATQGASTAGLPLFASAVGPNAVKLPEIVLHGLARGPRDQAALLTIGDAPAAWLGVGQSRDGITLIALTASSALVDTALGFRTLELGKPATDHLRAANASSRP